MMEFKVGDRVKILNTEFGNKDKTGTITNISGVVLIYFVEIEGDCGHVCQWSDASDLELVEEETSMKFKVGDKVKVSNSWEGRSGEVGEITRRNIWEAYPCRVTFEDGVYESFKEEELELVKEEEKVMKFKVGDKVRVKDSWFGHDGQVGVVFKIDNYEPYNYSVKFDAEGDNERRDENFKDDSLELVKQSFTKSDLKTGMGVVLRDGSKGHVLLDTKAGDVIRLINGESNEWMSTRDYDSEMRDSDIKPLDIMEVYSSRLAYCYVTERLFTDSNLVFKREEEPEIPEPTKMTMKEINEHFGKPIEIVE